MDTTTIIVMAIVVVGGMFLILRSGGGAGRGDAQAHGGPGATHTVTLDVAGGSPDDPGVRRMVNSIATRVFSSMDQVQVVRVVRRDQVELGTVRRSVGLAGHVADVDRLRAPAARGGHVPDPTDRERVHHPEVHHDQVDLTPPTPRTLLERFELPDSVVAALGDQQSPVDVVRAILVAGGRSAEVNGDVVLSGDDAIIVVGGFDGRPVVAEDLSRAYLHFEASGATRGIEVCLGPYDHADAHRRELLVPVLGHVGPDAVQRMADAVALGGDPLAFVLEPAIA